MFWVGRITQTNILQLIPDRVARKPEIKSKNFRFSTRRTRILMGIIISTIYHVVLIVIPMGRILVRWQSFRYNLKILCHSICNRLYFIDEVV